MHAGIPPPRDQADTPPDQTPPPQDQADPPQIRHHPPAPRDLADPPPDQTPPPLGPGRPPPGSRLQHTVYERPVRILLECILVLVMYIFMHYINLSHNSCPLTNIDLVSTLPLPQTARCGQALRINIKLF